MGMSAAQFFQVVLLPQGQFAKFLHSDAKERAALLQRLFGTDRFQAVERWLADRRVVTQRDVEAASDVVDRLLNRVAQEARAAVPDDTAVPADGAPWQVPWASELLRAARAKREAAANLAAARGQELDAAQAALSAAEQLADRQRRRADALSLQAALQAATSSIEALRGEYAAANRAAQVAAVLDVATEAARTAARARAAAERARTAVLAEAAPGDATAAALRGSARDQEARLVRLDTLRTVARQAELEDTAASAARERAASLAETLAATTSASGRTRAARPGKLQERDAASQAAADLPAAKTAADSRRGVAKNLAALVRERSARDRLAEAHRLAAAGALARQKESDRIHQVRIDGMSGELAKNLFDGFPCPVCGSLDHPDPSEMPASWVSPDEEKDAAAAARTAAAAAETASREVSAADAVIADLQARLAEAGTDAPADLIALATIAASAEADAARLEADASGLAKTAGRLGALQRELDDLDAAVAAADTRQAELTEQRTAALDEAQGAAQRAAGHRQALHAQLGTRVTSMPRWLRRSSSRTCSPPPPTRSTRRPGRRTRRTRRRHGRSRRRRARASAKEFPVMPSPVLTPRGRPCGPPTGGSRRTTGSASTRRRPGQLPDCSPIRTWPWKPARPPSCGGTGGGSGSPARARRVSRRARRREDHGGAAG